MPGLETIHSLCINPAKTDLMIVRCKQLRSEINFSINFGNTVIFPSPSVKVLGMAADCNLTWASHVSLVVRRCYAIISGLSKMSHRLSSDLKTFN